mmetsp:Transcript_57734/g.172301  ORF Transcript_57734/g.172301 Transcript_57734/m.172301 type:complete len:297 (-) Transcript_57734:433-1323(-)
MTPPSLTRTVPRWAEVPADLGAIPWAWADLGAIPWAWAAPAVVPWEDHQWEGAGAPPLPPATEVGTGMADPLQAGADPRVPGGTTMVGDGLAADHLLPATEGGTIGVAPPSAPAGSAGAVLREVRTVTALPLQAGEVLPAQGGITTAEGGVGAGRPRVRLAAVTGGRGDGPGAAAPNGGGGGSEAALKRARRRRSRRKRRRREKKRKRAGIRGTGGLRLASRRVFDLCLCVRVSQVLGPLMTSFYLWRRDRIWANATGMNRVAKSALYHQGNERMLSYSKYSNNHYAPGTPRPMRW